MEERVVLKGKKVGKEKGRKGRARNGGSGRR